MDAIAASAVQHGFFQLLGHHDALRQPRFVACPPFQKRPGYFRPMEAKSLMARGRIHDAAQGVGIEYVNVSLLDFNDGVFCKL